MSKGASALKVLLMYYDAALAGTVNLDHFDLACLAPRGEVVVSDDNYWLVVTDVGLAIACLKLKRVSSEASDVTCNT